MVFGLYRPSNTLFSFQGHSLEGLGTPSKNLNHTLVAVQNNLGGTQTLLATPLFSSYFMILMLNHYFLVHLSPYIMLCDVLMSRGSTPVKFCFLATGAL